MAQKRVLLMYLHEYSGHHHAALALEKAFHEAHPRTECLLVDTLRYAHPLLERLIRRTYLEIIRKKPEVWEYLYDNPSVLRNTQALRRRIHRTHSKKFKGLLDTFRPQAVVCTQAFPCGIVSDFKATFSYPVPLYGVLTDFLPHSYWALENVDRYFVASREAKEKLHEDGISEDRITVSGIPIDPKFSETVPAAARPKPVILLMGGSEGLGSIEKNVLALEATEGDFEIVVATGKNERLSRRLDRLKKKTRKKLVVHPYLKDTADLMKNASVLVSKPGGLTMSEALACRLPIIFVDSLPGQESKNAAYLLRHRAALEARSPEELSLYVAQLLRMPAKIDLMKKNMARLAKPDAALQIAQWITERDLTA